MYLQNPFYSKQSVELLATATLGDETQNGIKPNEHNKAFISIISHNIKNPFSALLGYSELLLEDYSELSDTERKELLFNIKNTGNLTYRFLERFFDWMYYKTDKLTPHFEKLNLRDVISLSENRLPTEQNYVGEINLNIDPEISILADQESIVKVFYYIIENSMKYGKTKVRIIINASDEGKYVVVEIIDFGNGISEDRLSKLFNISENIVQNWSSKECSTGMGLILTKQLLTLNRSRISIISTQGLGTKVILQIPGT